MKRVFLVAPGGLPETDPDKIKIKFLVQGRLLVDKPGNLQAALLPAHIKS